MKYQILIFSILTIILSPLQSAVASSLDNSNEFQETVVSEFIDLSNDIENLKDDFENNQSEIEDLKDEIDRLKQQLDN